MAKVSRPPPAVALVLVLVGLVAAVADAAPGPRGLTRYTRVFAFGNSLTDTGNAAIFPATAGGPFTRPPYGQTYFGQPSGRASDGRLIIDFLADELRVPQPTPYLAGRTAADFLNGTNFAVGGATALDPAFLVTKGIMSFVPISLSNQTSWFQNVLRLLNSSSVYEQRKVMASSVFYVGEIGLNDYFFALNSNSVDVAVSLVPHVIGAIRSALTAMIAAGARTVVVTGMLPIGCEPQQLALFPGGPGDYDPATGCIARFNEIAERHNLALRVMLGELRLAHPGRSLSYADIYRAVTRAVASPTLYGFGGMPLAACCGGGGGPYNFNFTTFCSAPGSAACADPSKSISWDGIHFTEAANRFLTRAMLKGLL
ncbi:hypothetical protein GQ55_9G306100 [Panicum hallii var. hallii]|uniref:GDSL esterase/lipase n=1 Tax=Panicum hallii var. hallii TaxID=1504633 RepID=A0A2T7C7U5_9POAL|nr:hypothetical protein GQ55_9G306100 [Panicum hallii var. hallii]